ncbi:hypothetical protein BS50DRAFT_131759 [Corynespora cassiicola Philippines]|uniref:Secreted protein n=1 Tax=Corynespora cassiicola Philippines TaxID=1448308 RepID=A0A2T2NBS7_CORCC|nr:hypothetical protein BS50DRAFT_131759 [Corynespora cassiicola Philippines]
MVLFRLHGLCAIECWCGACHPQSLPSSQILPFSYKSQFRLCRLHNQISQSEKCPLALVIRAGGRTVPQAWLSRSRNPTNALSAFFAFALVSVRPELPGAAYKSHKAESDDDDSPRCFPAGGWWCQRVALSRDITLTYLPQHQSRNLMKLSSNWVRGL